MSKANRFRNKYRIASPRIPWFDYGSNATYYINICTKNRREFLGSIMNGKMTLSGKTRGIDHPSPICSEQAVFIRISKSLIIDIEILTFRYRVLSNFLIDWSFHSGFGWSLAQDFAVGWLANRVFEISFQHYDAIFT